MGKNELLERVADKTSLIDLHHQGRRNVIAAAVLELDSGVAIVDPGPASTIPALQSGLRAAGIALEDVRALLATHVHLDHAGACGSWVRQNPKIRVYVHERGAPHMIDPSRLVASAARIFGDQMDSLWGEVAPVPLENLQVLAGGERIDPGGRRLQVAYTPGHASHHVSYYDTMSGIAFIGDAGGAKIRDGAMVLPATPPPDIDLDALRSSYKTLLEWEPERLFVTHFGPVTGVEEHGANFEEILAACAERVRQSLQDEHDDTTRSELFSAWVGAELRRKMNEEDAVAYEHGAPPAMSWFGLARYWRKAVSHERSADS